MTSGEAHIGRMQRSRRFFQVPVRGQIFVGLVATVFGAMIYFGVLWWAYAQLATAYRSANVFLNTLNAVPTVPHSPTTGANPSEARLAATFRVVQSLGGHPADATLSDVWDPGPDADGTDQPYWKVYSFMAEDALDADAEVPLLSDEVGTLDLVYELVNSLGGDDSDDGSDSRGSSAQRTKTVEGLARVLAGKPGVLEEYTGDIGARTGEGSVGAFRKAFSSEPILRGERVTKLLLEQLHLSTNDGVHALTTTHSSAGSGDQLHIETLVSFCANLVSQLHADPEVKKWRAVLTIVRGPEQFALIVLFLWTLGMLCVRAYILGERRRQASRVTGWLRRDIRKRLAARWELEQASRGTRSGSGVGAGQPKDIVTHYRDDIWAVAQNLLNLALTAAPPWDTDDVRSIVKKAEGEDGKLDEAERKVLKDELRNHSLLYFALSVCNTEIYRAHEQGSPTDPGVLESLCARLRRRIQSSRWMIGWVARAMPAIGFIGTVRGISGALSGADSIVRETTALGQAAAVSDVAGTLGIAFTTTLLALLFGLISSLFNDAQATSEDTLADDIEKELMPLLDVALLNLDIARS